MKSRTFEKELVLSETPTKESLEEAYKAYKPLNWKDAVITTILHNAAVEALTEGGLETPGIYRIGAEFFSKKYPWHKVRLYVRKIS